MSHVEKAELLFGRRLVLVNNYFQQSFGLLHFRCCLGSKSPPPRIASKCLPNTVVNPNQSMVAGKPWMDDKSRAGAAAPVGCQEACLHCESSQQSPNPGATGGGERGRERVHQSIEYNKRGGVEMEEMDEVSELRK